MLVQKVLKWMEPLDNDSEVGNDSMIDTNEYKFKSPNESSATSLLPYYPGFNENKSFDLGDGDKRSSVSLKNSFCDELSKMKLSSDVTTRSVTDVGKVKFLRKHPRKNAKKSVEEKPMSSIGAGDGGEISQEVRFLSTRVGSAKSSSTETAKKNSEHRQDNMTATQRRDVPQCCPKMHATCRCEQGTAAQVLLEELDPEDIDTIESLELIDPKWDMRLRKVLSEADELDGGVYGELAVLGCNGQPPDHLSGMMQSRYRLVRRARPNGVKEAYSFHSTHKHPVFSDKHTVFYHVAAGRSVVVEYVRDQETDMFQIGRFETDPVDFRVLDVNRARNGVSRFACRILVKRHGRHEARVYAAAFDPTGNIFLGEGALTCVREGKMDGFTTNGVLIMHPKTQPLWREVSVCGFVYPLRSSSMDPRKRPRIPDESNVLQDGTLIDLCGVTLVWRTPEGLRRTPNRVTLKKFGYELKSWTPEYEIPLRSAFDTRKGRRSHAVVFQSCGHVMNLFGVEQSEALESWMCPVCRSIGPISKLHMGMEPSFYVDCGFLSHAFRPCGHAASHKTVLYWSAMTIPEHRSFQEGLCPFCGVKLNFISKYVELKYPE